MTTPSAKLGLRLTNLSESLKNDLVGRCIKIYRFEPHPRKKILIIVGQTTISVVNPMTGNITRQLTEDFKKSVHLLGISEACDSKYIANEILTAYPFILENLASKLKEAIDEIKIREYDRSGTVILNSIAEDGSFVPRYPEIFEEYDMTDGLTFPSTDADDQPDLGKLDHYVEQLYEDIQNKVDASFKIAKLTELNSYLYDIINHDSAFNAVVRTLREDSKTSMTLTINILQIVLNTAKIKEFQSVVIKHKLPQLILDIVDYEIGRCEKWKAQVSVLEEQNLSSPKAVNDYQVMFKRLVDLSTTQNSLLKVGYEILHCVSEIKEVRENLLSQGIISSFALGIVRQDNELLEVILLYLLDMSSFIQPVEEMIISEVVEKLTRILKGGVPVPKKIVRIALQILYNLSFHEISRRRIVDCGLIRALSNCFAKKSFQDIVVKTLYVLSMDVDIRPKLARTSLVKDVMTSLTQNELEEISPELGCLAVNLAKNDRCGEAIWESNTVSKLLKNAIQNEDCLAMKIIRNLVELDSAFVLYESVGDIAKTMIASTNPRYITECIGTLGCFDSLRVNIQELTQHGKIFCWIRQNLGYYIDILRIGCPDHEVLVSTTEAVLETVLLFGSLSKSKEAIRIIIAEGFGDLLLKVLMTGQEKQGKDLEIVQQILYIFNKWTEHQSIAIYLSAKTGIPTALLEFGGNSTKDLRLLCESFLERISEFDDKWKEHVQEYKFMCWNSGWTDQIAIKDMEKEYDEARVITGIHFDDHQPMSTSSYANFLREGTLLDEDFEPSSVESASDNDDSYENDDSLDFTSPIPQKLFVLFQQQFEEERALVKKRVFADNSDTLSFV